MKSLADFLAELKRRRVFRVAAVYACVAFIICQIIDATFDYLPIPDWVGTTVIVLLAVGFPIAVAMAWAFDLTNEGLVRTKPKREAAATKAPHPLVGNKTLAVIAVVAVAVAVWSWLGRSSAAGTISSIAVLPLDNQMGDPEQEYFVDGMHDALTGEMSAISALRVIGRTSTLSYKGNPKPIPEIAEELDVDAVIEGSVLRFPDGETIRIIAQLVTARPERQIFYKEYLGNLTDILSIHKTIVADIAAEIGLALTQEEETDLATSPQVNPEAYNLYLKGWHFRTQYSISKAIEYLEQSVALDSTFARAWVALAHCYTLNFSTTMDFNFRTNLSKWTVDKALELDPNLPEAHGFLGYWSYGFKRDFSVAEAPFRRALELDPDNLYSLYEYGLFLIRTGRPEEGLAKVRRVLDLDPLNPEHLLGNGIVYWRIRQYDKALEYLEAALELAPDNQVAGNYYYYTKYDNLMEQGRYAEAAAEAEKRGDLFRQVQAEWALGNKDKVYAIRDSLISSGDLQQWEQENPFLYARFYVILGEREQALDLLEAAYEAGPLNYIQRCLLVYNPVFDFLRAEPRFKALLQRLGMREVFDENGQLLRPLDESLEAYHAPGVR